MPRQIRAAPGDDVEAERPVAFGEEELAADLAGQRALQPRAAEQVGGEARDALGRWNIGEPSDSGPYSNSTTKTSGERMSSVTPAPKSPRASGSGKVARWTTEYVVS